MVDGPWFTALIGGILTGTGATLLLALNGRIAGGKRHSEWCDGVSRGKPVPNVRRRRNLSTRLVLRAVNRKCDPNQVASCYNGTPSL